MFKKESIYNNDGELVTMRTTQYKGHFNDDRGYAAYYNGKTIMSRVDAVYPEGVKDMDIGKMMKLSRPLQPGANYLGYKGNKSIIHGCYEEKDR
ncbi:hypothetical protein V6B14_12830 [Sporosarcina psychrophila]|uniref:hypothetical protein n=1 Tax=Sporosarcina psychrophila TaxID=1476 RepID=UPI0030D4E273